jgi:hypothetical protein
MLNYLKRMMTALGYLSNLKKEKVKIREGVRVYFETKLKKS